jgi:muramoyltetrapeptide carboxypeptidase
MSGLRPSTDLLVPEALRPGARVRVIAPSSPFDRTLFFRGIGWLGERYRVSIGVHTLEREGFLAGRDAARLADLDAALADPELDAIVAARGGYGAGRIAHRASWQALREHPKWLVGFSDVTLLHLEAQRVGVASLHAENAAGLGRGDAHARQAWISALERPLQARNVRGTGALGQGQARGPLIGGNLTMLFAAQAAGRLRLPQGAILAIEDVTEAPYRVDRMLTALIVAGVFEPLSAVVVGDFTDCPAGRHGVAVEAVLAERLGTLGLPVLLGMPFGHGRPNVPLPLGLEAELDTELRCLRVGLTA